MLGNIIHTFLATLSRQTQAHHFLGSQSNEELNGLAAFEGTREGYLVGVL